MDNRRSKSKFVSLSIIAKFVYLQCVTFQYVTWVLSIMWGIQLRKHNKHQRHVTVPEFMESDMKQTIPMSPTSRDYSSRADAYIHCTRPSL